MKLRIYTLNKRKKVQIFLSFLILCLFFTSNKAYSVDLKSRVIEHTFDNGLKLLMVERHNAPTLSTYIRFKAGAVDETTGNAGIAHMLEHMLFKGTKTVGTSDFLKELPILKKIDELAFLIDSEKREGEKKDEVKLKKVQKDLKALQKEHRELVVSEEFSRIYAENGGVGYNAFTSMDTTTYVISLPSNKLKLWANIESDRMKHPVLREFYAERDVVMEERRRSIDSNPWGVLYEQFIAAAYTAHPYGKPVIGWMSDVEYLSKTAAKDFLKIFYSPNNAVIAIVGDINPDEVINLIDKKFGDILPQKLPKPIMTKEPKQLGERRIKISWDSEPGVLIGFHKPTLPHPDDDVFDVIDTILSSGRTSRLYKTIVQEKQLATVIGTYGAPGSRFPNLFCIYAAPRYPHTTLEVETAIYAELEKMKNEPVTDRELQKVKNNIDANLIRGLKSNSGLAGMLSSYEVLAGSWKYILHNRDRIKTITKDEIMDVARRYFTKDNRTIAFIEKKGAVGKKQVQEEINQDSR